MHKPQINTTSPVVARVRQYDGALRNRLGRGCDVVAGSRELARRINHHRHDAKLAA